MQDLMTLLIGINFNSEYKLDGRNCVPAAAKYPVTGRNLHWLSRGILLLLQLTLQDLTPKDEVSVYHQWFIILAAKKVVISEACLTLEVILHPK